MSRHILFIFALIWTGLIASCSSSEKSMIGNQPIPPGKTVYFYYYIPGAERSQLKAYPIELQNEATTADAYKIIIDKLSYEFSKGGSTQPVSNIKFELLSITNVETTIRKYPVAVINIIDPQNALERIYFQGSTGGMETQNTILLNILQPHITGFMDGCIIHINNFPIGEKDHVNFMGIKSAADFQYLAESAAK